MGPTLLVLATGVAVFFIRKRNKQNNKDLAAGVDTGEKDWEIKSKAQLHADSIGRPRYELESERSPETVSELPVLEPVGSELPVQK